MISVVVELDEIPLKKIRWNSINKNLVMEKIINVIETIILRRIE